MHTLRDILKPIDYRLVSGDTDRMVAGVQTDSRKVKPGDVFIAVKGTLTDGHDYLEKAVAQGAGTLVVTVVPENRGDFEGVTVVKVEDTEAVAGILTARFYGDPSAQMKVVGVTGTNGKTTTATLLYQLFEKLGYRCGLLSTVKNRIHDGVAAATHTTPDPVTLQELLREMADAGCSHVFMEVSSHAIHQRRVAGIHFAGGIFTNITHDHLDYHKTFDEYIRVKKRFFDDLSEDAFALTNLDDKRGMVMLQNTRAEKNTYSLRSPATIKGKVLENNLTGLSMIIDGQEAHFRLIGTFNAYNLLAVYGAAKLLGEDRMAVLEALSGLQGAEGRFETFMSPNERILGIVDYAHTPDALINVLATINQLRKSGEQLITVIGCGGDRDTTKRPLMAQVACEHSDKTILTSDNPRSEDPEAILDDMEAGLTPAQKRKSLRITDRAAAIKTACMMANGGDIILVAGKGHESYQEIKGIRHHFDDREQLTNTFETLYK